MSKQICPIIGKKCIKEKCMAYTPAKKNLQRRSMYGQRVYDKTREIPTEPKFEQKITGRCRRI